MRRLFPIAFPMLMLCACAHAQPAGETGACAFLFDGVDRGDGMAVVLDVAERQLVVTSDGYRMQDCRGEGWPVCFTSSYMRLAIPDPRAKRWSREGASFDLGLPTTVKVGGQDVKVDVIHSTQGNGDFDFYFSDADGLVGWSHRYVAFDGVLENDRILYWQKEPGRFGCKLKEEAEVRRPGSPPSRG